MKKGFTLIELLIVTVVIVALMGVIFRLTGIAGSTSARETTVFRMQCLENCLSGYYAVFGSYPPVPLQNATRNIFRFASSRGIQSDEPNDLWGDGVDFNNAKNGEGSFYDSVEAACKAQPVRASYPPPEGSHAAYEQYKARVLSAISDGVFSDYSKNDREKVQNWSSCTLDDVSGAPGFLSPYKKEKSYNQLQLFRFGLMSFLLPRYRFMLDCAKGTGGGGAAAAFNDSIDNFKQWTVNNNVMPPQMETGTSYASWSSFCNLIDSDDDWQIDLIPSQAACARWMPNLKGTVVSGPERKFFGVTVAEHGGMIPEIKSAPSFALYYPGGYGGGSDSRGYPLLHYTVVDGWGKDLFYYSPAPYQMYALWSAGENGKTFPPWVDLEQLNNAQRNAAIEWMSDDIKYMATGK